MSATWESAVYSWYESSPEQRRPGAGGGHGVRAGVTAVGVDAGPGAPAHVRRAPGPRTGALACALAAGAGLDPGPRRPGAGPRPAHDWRLAGGLSSARVGRIAGCPARRRPPRPEYRGASGAESGGASGAAER